VKAAPISLSGNPTYQDLGAREVVYGWSVVITFPIMGRPCTVVLSALLLAAAAVAVDLQLTITRKTPLKGELQELVTFGLLKEMTCDTNGNIFSPSNRKYGDAINSIVRFPSDASSFTTFPIDSNEGLDGGTITDFDLEPSGELFVLARQVLKYSDLEVPVEFGKNFILRYDQNAKILSRRELKLDTNNFTPTGIAVLQDDEILVVGKHLEKDRTFLIAEIFHSDGSLKSRFILNPEGTKTSKGKTASSARVFNPAAIKANGLIYVLRGTTTEPIYILSETGHLLKTIRLKPMDVEFDSAKVLGNELIVSEHPSIIIGVSTGSTLGTRRRRKDLPIFSLETGEIIDRYFWYNETAGLACVTAHFLTFIGQDVSTKGFDWAVFEAMPAGSDKKETSATRR
jgi:hypothetical protein